MTAVYKAISNVAREMAETGIKKRSVNQQQGFMFRGIDAVYNALAPALVKHGLLILPRIIERTVTERQTQRGSLLFYVVVKAEFEFVSVEDGSKHTVVTYGEAMDSGDKATNKAMSIAYKYAAFQTFCIPTEETAIDADAEVHNVAPRTPDQILKDFTNSAMAITDLNILKKEFGETWKLLRKTPEQSKAKEVYNIRKSELEAM
ncbi:ERF family protein [Proteus mirabilis]|uniref:ERF family protein n=1 Tax=Proteus mirabilis TaxID=584 RepID=UPI0018C60BDC|nr:ERF family protein [Proteus mirabilis]EKT8413091.1 ERF family protein [Proteus mirabilis]EKU7619242.1 ERF family protein [Proteus mirabilis]ELT7779736.1 ERF family protein [Proteus mirabilis]MBG2831838.1 ERF family protein [Proteus mirabilis]HEK1866765.1 ERF family protein [Proteus mirabilis]